MPGSAFHIFNLIGTAMMGFFIGRIMVHTQILVQGWETRTSISVLFCRRTLTDVYFPSVAQTKIKSKNKLFQPLV